MSTIGKNMDMPRGINVRQLLEYAKDNGYNSVKFLCKNEKTAFVGEFLDAYYELVKIPALGNGFVTLEQIEHESGYDVVFDVLDEETYRLGAKVDCILHGKTPPSEDGSEE